MALFGLYNEIHKLKNNNKLQTVFNSQAKNVALNDEQMFFTLVVKSRTSCS